MTGERDRFGAEGFELAWAAFTAEDRAAMPPASLEARVLAAVRRGPVPPRRWSARAAPIAAGLAAAVLLGTAATLVIRWPRPATLGDVVQTRPQPSTGVVPPRQSVDRPSPPKSVPTRRRHTRRVSSPPFEALPPALMTLAAAPIGDSEPLQLVRVRLPREALQTLGLDVPIADADGTVDVDVLVGEDGLARDIRHVRTGQE